MTKEQEKYIFDYIADLYDWNDEEVFFDAWDFLNDCLKPTYLKTKDEDEKKEIQRIVNDFVEQYHHNDYSEEVLMLLSEYGLFSFD